MFYQWDEKYLSIGELSTSYFENSWDKGNPEFLKTNFIKNLLMIWKYLHHLVRETQESSIPGNPFSILFPDQFCNLTWKEFMIRRLEDSNQTQALYLVLGIEDKPSKTPGMNPTRILTNSILSRKASREKYLNIPCSRMRSILKPSIEIFWSQPQLMDVRKSGKEIICQGMMMIVSKIVTKQYLMYSVFNKVLQSDMGKTIARKYVPTLDAPSVWREF